MPLELLVRLLEVVSAWGFAVGACLGLTDPRAVWVLGALLAVLVGLFLGVLFHLYWRSMHDVHR